MKKFFISLIWLFVIEGASAQLVDEPVTLNTATGQLKGTLVRPAKGKKFNLMILQPGSGPTDRNGNNPMGVKAKSYRLLADTLAQKGIATLLIDKRGIAGSAAAGSAEELMSFDDYINDLVLWAQQMKADKRFKKIILAGHSEGSLVAMVAAQKTSVDKYVSIAGPGEAIDKIIIWQLQQQSPSLAHQADSLFMRLKAGDKIDSVPPPLFSLLRPSVQPYMKSWMQYDPCQEIKRLAIPVLIVQGSTDIQVQEKEGLQLRQCNPAATLKIIKEMNHVLKTAPADRAQNFKTYANEALPIHPLLVKELLAFIK